MKLTSKTQAAFFVSCAALAVLIVMGGLLIVPRYAIIILTTGAAVFGGGALVLMPGMISTERYRRSALGEGTGAFDASAHRGVCDSCGWHWRGRSTDDACPRCGSPIERVNAAETLTASN